MPGTLKILASVEQPSLAYFKFQDLTQPYSPTNLTGWLYEPAYVLGPNPFIKNISTAYLGITPPNGVQVVLDMLASPRPLYDVTNGVIKNPKIITVSDMGVIGATSHPDGLYIFDLQVTGGFPADPDYAFNANPIIPFYSTANVSCCVRKLWQKVKTTNAKCCSKEYLQWLQAEVYLKGIQNNANPDCKKYAQADLLLAELKKLCIDAGCGGCTGCP